MASVNTYVNFDGNCAQAFDFYKSVFGGSFLTKMAFGDAPGMGAVSMAGITSNRIGIAAYKSRRMSARQVAGQGVHLLSFLAGQFAQGWWVG